MTTIDDRTFEPIATGLVFPEGPRWHDDRLWFSDIGGRTIHVVGADGELSVVARLDDSPSGLGFMPDGSILVALMRRAVLVRIVDGEQVIHADLTGLGGDFLNDMVVDPNGRAFVDLRRNHAQVSGREANEMIVVVEPDGAARVVAEGLAGPNGLVLTDDHRTLHVAETYGERISSFTVDAEGGLSDRRLFAATPGRYPDGICLDAEGALWFGSPHSHEFVRVADGGDVLERIDLGSSWGVACVLGRTDRRTLYLLISDVSQGGLDVFAEYQEHLMTLSDPQRERLRAAGMTGRIAAMDVLVPGVGTP